MKNKTKICTWCLMSLMSYNKSRRKKIHECDYFTQSMMDPHFDILETFTCQTVFMTAMAKST